MAKHKKTENKKLLTFKDFGDDIFNGFNFEKERIRYMSNNYDQLSLTKMLLKTKLSMIFKKSN